MFKPFASAGIVVVAAAWGLGQTPGPGPAPTAEVQRLIDQLGSQRFSEREAATAKLIGMERARPYIERLARTPDEEVVARARQILTHQDRAFAATRLPRYFRYGREGQVERMVEGLCRWTGPIDNEGFWQEVRAVAVVVWEKADQRDVRLPRPNDVIGNFERANARAPQREPEAPVLRRLSGSRSGHMLDGGYLSPGARIQAGHLANTTVVSTGPVSVRGGSASAILLTTEDYVSGDHSNSRVAHCVVVSAGRVVLRRTVDDALVVARGDIDVAGCTVRSSQLVAAGKIVGDAKPAAGSRFQAAGSQKSPLGFIKWFETATVGFEAVAADSGIKVASVAADSVAGKAGLKAGDVITAIDDEPAKTPVEEFRKQLRRGSVQDGCFLTVRRGRAAETVFLDFRGDNLPPAKSPGSPK